MPPGRLGPGGRTGGKKDCWRGEGGEEASLMTEAPSGFSRKRRKKKEGDITPGEEGGPIVLKRKPKKLTCPGHQRRKRSPKAKGSSRKSF